MAVAIFFDILILGYFLSRQLRVRPVPRLPRLQIPVLLGVIGLVELLDYSDGHHVSGTDWAWFFATLALGAVVLGALRAFTVKLWTSNGWVLRQGTWLTMALWALSIGLHFAADYGADRSGAGDLVTSSLLLYFGVTYAVQNYVVHQRATPLWDALGPDAGRGVRISFGPGRFGGGGVFTTFGSGAPAGPGATGRPPYGDHDPGIIDAEVVEDDEGPAELH
ncbi:MAG TPA: hypothetical protein VL961_10795 [Acidimicrobiales bacterium]|nr:hypothetical protein [Acidimicrobiales bacterium]